MSSKIKKLPKATVGHFVNPFMFLTGSWLYNIVVNLEQFGSLVFTNSIQNQDIFPYDKVYSEKFLPAWKKLGEKACRKIFKTSLFKQIICKKNNVKILHSHFGWEGCNNIAFADRLKIPHIVSFYGADMSSSPNVGQWREKYKELFEKVSLVIAEGPFARKTIIELGCPPEKAVICRLGVDLLKIPFKKRSLEKREAVKILVAGTFREKKGIPYAIEAFALTLKHYPNMKMTLVGDSRGFESDEIEKNKIFTIIQKYHIEDKVNWLGYIPHQQLLKLSYDHHIFMAPSVTAENGDSEGGSPVIITEMAASGIMIISTRHADIPEVILDGKSGWLVSERNIRELTEGIQQMIKNADQWKLISQSGRKHIEQNYDLNRQIQFLEQFYKGCIN